LNNKSEAHSLKLSVTLMLKAKSLPLTSISAKPLKLPSKKISHSFFSMSLIAPAKSSSPLSIRSLSLSSKKDSRRLFSSYLLAKFSPDGLKRTELKRDLTVELYQLSTQPSSMSSSSLESLLDSELELDLTDHHSQKLLSTRTSSISLKKELMPLKLPTED